MTDAAPLSTRVLTVVSLWMSRVGGVLLLASAATISFEVVGRKVFLLPIELGTELSTYALAVAASWSFSYALLQRAHVRIDFFRRSLPPGTRAALDLLAVASLAGLSLLLTWHAAETTLTSWRFHTRANTPLATLLAGPQTLWLWGMAWFAIVSVEQTVWSLVHFACGNTAMVLRMADPPNPEAEFEDVLVDAAGREPAPRIG